MGARRFKVICDSCGGTGRDGDCDWCEGSGYHIVVTKDGYVPTGVIEKMPFGDQKSSE